MAVQERISTYLIRLKAAVQRPIDARFSDQRFAAIKRGLDNVLPMMLLLVTFLVIFQFVLDVTARVKAVLAVANWAVAAYFAVRLAVDFKLSDPGEPFLKQHWMEMIMVIPLFSLLQEARLLKLVQESELIGTELALTEQELLATSSLRNTQIAAKLTKIIHLVRRSF